MILDWLSFYSIAGILFLGILYAPLATGELLWQRALCVEKPNGTWGNEDACFACIIAMDTEVFGTGE